MKLETLLKRFEKVGYQRKNLSKELEIASLIQWIYITYNEFITVYYVTMKFPNYLNFISFRYINLNSDAVHTFHSDKFFKNPYDAMFQALVECSRGLKFKQKHESKTSTKSIL
jgi:hypothetical protein